MIEVRLLIFENFAESGISTFLEWLFRLKSKNGRFSSTFFYRLFLANAGIYTSIWLKTRFSTFFRKNAFSRWSFIKMTKIWQKLENLVNFEFGQSSEIFEIFRKFSKNQWCPCHICWTSMPTWKMSKKQKKNFLLQKTHLSPPYPQFLF